MDLLRDVGLVAALVTTGLMAGIYLAFSISVLPGLGRTDDATFVTAMRAMNAAILNPVFAVVFAGPLLLDLVALVAGLAADQPDTAWIGLALATYAATLAITAAVNVPLNNRLDATEPASEARALFESRWVRWNVVRTALTTASVLALVPALS